MVTGRVCAHVKTLKRFTSHIPTPCIATLDPERECCGCFAVGIIEVAAEPLGTPVLQDAHQPAGFNLPLNQISWLESQAQPIQCSIHDIG